MAAGRLAALLESWAAGEFGGAGVLEQDVELGEKLVKRATPNPVKSPKPGPKPVHILLVVVHFASLGACSETEGRPDEAPKGPILPGEVILGPGLKCPYGNIPKPMRLVHILSTPG